MSAGMVDAVLTGIGSGERADGCGGKCCSASERLKVRPGAFVVRRETRSCPLTDRSSRSKRSVVGPSGDLAPLSFPHSSRRRRARQPHRIPTTPSMASTSLVIDSSIPSCKSHPVAHSTHTNPPRVDWVFELSCIGGVILIAALIVLLEKVIPSSRPIPFSFPGKPRSRTRSSFRSLRTAPPLT